MDWNLYLNFVAAIVAILNPMGILPVWVQLTNDATKKVRREIAYMIIGTTALILLVFLNTGEYLLEFFSIDLPVFKIAGGLLLLFTGVSMVNGKASQLEDRKEQGDTAHQIAKSRFRKIIVPLAVPMLSGPGSLTMVILFGFSAQKTIDYFLLSIILLLSLLILLIVFVYSSRLERKIDPIVFNVFTRIFGIIVTAIAIQFMLEGTGSVFPNLLDGGSPLEQGGMNGGQSK
ncbi:MAG: MarC family protein [Bacteroidales bacterium]|nr:MarC family protein [Bacteroidales bacterium]MCF8345293.1 MarC family protein [Bacteroidales bacterium]MCF8352322.1 MarC family protein [Bacteroidales bacterium]MCF8377398.1 MarC family protein [Bacteroidales bacterium]MCF8401323.1 MarC family protein [Bacteroidales bacterium]